MRGPSSHGPRRRLLGAGAVLALGLLVTGCSSDSSAQAGAGEIGQGSAGSAGSAGAGAAGASPRSGSTAAHRPLPSWIKNNAANVAIPARIGTVSEVAQAGKPSVAVYRSPADATAWMTLKNPQPSKAPLVFLVQQHQGGWLRVLLPVRPNQSQGWIRAADVTLSQHGFRIVVSVGEHTLTLYRGASVVLREKAGLGTSTTPTPGGVYFTKELLKPPNPRGPYGPYAYGLSGYSPVLTEFLGGDGEIGIHGTDDPAGLGKDVSHGCIRLSNAAITKLAGMLPLGVPVQIVR